MEGVGSPDTRSPSEGAREGRPTVLKHRQREGTCHKDLLQYLVTKSDGAACDLSNSSNNHQQLLWRCKCGNPRHMRLLQLRSITASINRKRRNASNSHALWCRVCGPPGKRKNPASMWEQQLYALLTRRYPELDLWIESEVFRSELATRVDIYMPALQLAVFVDGQQHFVSSGAAGMHGADAQQQAERDAAVNDMVVSGRGLKHGVKGVLRLHWQNEAQWGATLQAAMLKACDATQGPFLMLTNSYMLNPK
eukprot:CAMPEP_0202856982 /NCGR_PEP_ID=MMETSP1391-20130828/84_1 /ASSEMBLY_ACC=CAM_ASM_000867 /TAXON_ID=1034604 /ORGANISM="Chlamydomonas leiostraca, Strain SAG 11-49" /LENGTH=250 /DNA_ID=CAMNT_0049535717 /DNA_START=706 /DNA_END=1458 /DNA_ORIENTATION=-